MSGRETHVFDNDFFKTLPMVENEIELRLQELKREK